MHNESDAKTHRTPKALRAKSTETPLEFRVSFGECLRASRRSWGAPLGHRTRTFREEYLELLRRSGVEFDERYV